jgi:hypothetical protein
MAEIGETGPGHEADIAGADHCDTHLMVLVRTIRELMCLEKIAPRTFQTVTVLPRTLRRPSSGGIYIP